jgi:hypothetical protein
MRGRKRCLIWIACVAALATAATATAAPAEDVTRSQYAERAEAVCKPVSQTAKPMIARALSNLKKNQVKPSGRELLEVAKTYEALRAHLRAIAPPPADAGVLRSWLKRLQEQNAFLRDAGRELSRERRVPAQGFLARFVHSGNLANDLVLGFGFNYCLFKQNA